MSAKPAPKPMGRPKGTGLPPEAQKVHVTARIAPEQMRLARHLFGGPGSKTDGAVVQMALEWAVLDAGRHLPPDKRAQIERGESPT